MGPMLGRGHFGLSTPLPTPHSPLFPFYCPVTACPVSPFKFPSFDLHFLIGNLSSLSKQRLAAKKKENTMYRKTWTAAFRKAFATSAAVAGIATLLVCTTGTASAQDSPPPPPGGQGGPGRGPGMRGPRMGGPGPQHTAQMVNRPDIGQDLGITQDQRDQFRDMMDKMREKMRSQMQPPTDGGRPDPKAMRARMESMLEEMDKGVTNILTAPQRTRLTEIKIQLSGTSAVLDKEIQKGDRTHNRSKKQNRRDRSGTATENGTWGSRWRIRFRWSRRTWRRAGIRRAGER